MNHLYSRPMRELDEVRLRNLLQIGTSPMPQSVVEVYWRKKVMFDRLGAAMTPDTIVAIAEESGVEIPMPKPPSLRDELEAGLHDKGAMIEIKWRNRWKLVEFVSASSKGVTVVIDGVDQTFKDDREMRLPELAEV